MTKNESFNNISKYIESFLIKHSDKFEINNNKKILKFESVKGLYKSSNLIQGKDENGHLSPKALNIINKSLQLMRDALEEKSSIVVQFRDYRDFLPANLMKTFIANVFKQVDSPEDIKKVYNVLFKNLPIDDMFHYIDKLNKKYALELLKFSNKKSEEECVLLESTIKRVISYFPHFKFSQEEIRSFLPIFTDNYDHVFTNKNGNYDIQQELFKFIKDNLEEKERKEYIKYLPRYKEQILPSEEELKKSILIDEDKPTIIFKLDRENISKKFPALIMSEDVLKMTESLKACFNLIGNDFNIDKCELHDDLYHDEHQTDTSTFLLISKDEKQLDYKKLKLLLNELVLLYANEKTNSYTPDVDYLVKAARFIGLSNSIQEKNEINKKFKI